MAPASKIIQLESELGSPHSLITDLSSHQTYFKDATDLSARPIALLMAESTGDVVTAVRFCLEHGIPVTPRGAGTGLSGGCVPSTGALVVSTELMDSLDILPQEKMAVCGPGVITKDLMDQAACLGLTYPPDPASYAECTLGGNIAEGAGGLRCKRFGVTKDYVLGLEAVTGDGELIRTGILNENRGFCLGDLLIGSEGTLAVVTSIVVRLIEAPGRGCTILAAFGNSTDAARAVSDITSSGMIPTVLEYLDGDTVTLANEYEKTEGIDKAAAVLLIETSDKDMEGQTKAVDSICRRHSSQYLRTESDPDRAETLWQVRRNVSKAAKELSKVKVSEDVAVPNSRFSELVEFVAQLNRSSSVRINSYGHAGDGNLHVNLLSSSGSDQDLKEIDEAVHKLMQKAIELDGTLSGEHGIGLVKREFVELEFDEPTLQSMRLLRDIFDCAGVLNPEKLFLP